MSEIEDVTEWLFGLTRFGVKNGTDNIHALLRRLGYPQLSFRAIHVAGSDGKGSACAMIDSVLRESGVCTGLFTSPHILRPNERIRVDGECISDDDFVRLAHLVRKEMDSLAEVNIRCTFFEAVTAMAFVYFRERGVEYAVVEVGMGGRFDATNVIAPDVSVITNISLEHTQYLGDTIAKIAFEKAGIIKPGIPTVTCNSGDALEVITAVASEMCSDLTVTQAAEPLEADASGITMRYDGTEYRVGIPGSFQSVNAPMAIEALRIIGVDQSAIAKGLEKATWPGRMEKIAGLPLIIDVTHTAAGMRALSSDIMATVGRTVTVFGVLDDKDVGHMAGYVSEMSDEVIVVRPPSERAMQPERVLGEIRTHTDRAESAQDVGAAIDRALSIAGGRTVLVTGSFAMAEGAYRWLEARKGTVARH